MLGLGKTLATMAHRPLARLWNIIFSALDSEGGDELVNSRVIWMPSHKSIASIGTVAKSNGHFIDALEWRANRLVDKLAKLAAQLFCVPDLAVSIYNDAMEAAEYAAALVGTVTHAANHHSVEITMRNGKQGKTTLRDSCPGTRPFKPVRPGDMHIATPPPPALSVASSSGTRVSYDRPAPKALQAAKHKRARTELEQRNEAMCMANWRDNGDSQPAPFPPPTNASDRILALRRRVGIE
jgi:hypothetical protein